MDKLFTFKGEPIQQGQITIKAFLTMSSTNFNFEFSLKCKHLHPKAGTHLQLSYDMVLPFFLQHIPKNNMIAYMKI